MEVEVIGGSFGSYQFEALWKILNGSASRYAAVTRRTITTRNVPFPGGVCGRPATTGGVYRLDLEGKFNGRGKAFIELGEEPPEHY